jgi:phage terminase small subunit
MTTERKPRALSQKMEAFAQAIAAGSYQADAYRMAYPTAQDWQDSAVWTEASRLAKDPRVAARIAELQAKGAEASVFTLADHLRNLAEISRAALAAKDFTAAARAEESRGKASGFYVQKHELTGKGGGPIETKQTRDLTDEELKAELARHGIQP